MWIAVKTMWLRNKWMLPNCVIHMSCWISIKLQVHHNKDHYVLVIVQWLLWNACDLFSRIFEVFSEMEVEINVINNKIFTKFYLKIRVRGKEIS